MMRALWGVIVAVVLLAAPARGQDAIDLGAAVFHGTPVADFPVTATIERLEVRPSGPYRTDGILVFSSGVSAWPDVHAMGVGGTGGALQYTTWVCVPLDKVHCAGFVQHWRSEDGRGTGGPWLQRVPDGRSNWSANWAYDGRFGALSSYVPKAGDRVFVFLVAGNTRTGQAPEFATVGGQPYRARTNVVAIAYPASDAGVFTFAAGPGPAPVPGPLPAPGPTPGPVVAPGPGVDVGSLQRQIEELKGWVAAAVGDVSKGLEALTGTVGAHATAIDALGGRVVELEARPIPTRCRGGINLLGLARLSIADCVVVP